MELSLFFSLKAKDLFKYHKKYNSYNVSNIELAILRVFYVWYLLLKKVTECYQMCVRKQ